MIRRALVALALAACSRTDELAALRSQAAEIAATYQPKLDALVVRIHGLQRGLRGDLPGWPNMLRAAELASDELGLPPFTQVVPPGPEWKPSPTTLLGMGAYVRARAEELARRGDRDQLRFLVEDERSRYDRGIASVTEHLVQVETWLAAQR